MDRSNPPGQVTQGRVEYAGGACWNILPRTDYTLTGAANTVYEIVLAKYVDTLAFVSGVLICRLYSKGTFTTGVTVDIVVQNVSFAEDEPQTIFAETTNETTVSITSTTPTAPSLLTAAIETPIARHVRVLLRMTQPVTAPGPVTFAIGVDLVGRDA